MTNDHEIKAAELARLRSETERNNADRIKLEAEANQIQRQLKAKWYRGRALWQTTIGGIVAAALLSAWVVGFFEPILTKKTEIATLDANLRRLELQELDAELQELKAQLSIESDQNRAELEDLLQQNKNLAAAQEESEKLAEALKQNLKAESERVFALGQKYARTDFERKQLDSSNRVAKDQIENLTKQVSSFNSLSATSAVQTKRLDEKLSFRAIGNVRIEIYYTVERESDAKGVAKILESLGAYVSNVELNQEASLEPTLYYIREKISAAKEISNHKGIAKIIGKIQMKQMGGTLEYGIHLYIR